MVKRVNQRKHATEIVSGIWDFMIERNQQILNPTNDFERGKSEAYKEVFAYILRQSEMRGV